MKVVFSQPIPFAVDLLLSTWSLSICYLGFTFNACLRIMPLNPYSNGLGCTWTPVIVSHSRACAPFIKKFERKVHALSQSPKPWKWWFFLQQCKLLFYKSKAQRFDNSCPCQMTAVAHGTRTKRELILWYRQQDSIHKKKTSAKQTHAPKLRPVWLYEVYNSTKQRKNLHKPFVSLQREFIRHPMPLLQANWLSRKADKLRGGSSRGRSSNI